MFFKKITGLNWPVALLLLCSTESFSQHIVRYDLFIKDTIVRYGGKDRKAFSVNGQIPMPTLTFTEGDSAVIYVHNQLKEETSLHWHGILLPNEMDGVPYLTSAPVKPGSTYLYTFKIRQNGTYWYHSHYGLQEQIGLYGMFIIHKKQEDSTRTALDALPEYPVLLSDWTNEKPSEVHRKLHNASDWYAIRKNTTQSYSEAIQSGHLKTKLENEWKRMLPMDVSDVYYEQFLLNGNSEQDISTVNGKKLKPGDRVRLRIANGAASTYFWLNYAGGKITVIASDGMDVQPVAVDRLIVGVSETYDVIVTIPKGGTAAEFLATSEDRTGAASLFLGSGVKQLQSRLPKLKYFEGMKMMNDMMDMHGNMYDMGMNMSLQQMDMNQIMYPEMKSETMSMNSKDMQGMNMHDSQNMKQGQEQSKSIVTLNYSMLKAPFKTNLPENAPVKVLTFTLTGNMNRYVWSLDNKVISESDKIQIKKGEQVRIILINNSMMRHPMHLHGHFFRVLNGQGDYAPLKNVLDILPMETDTIEFSASEQYGDWFFHCHILYHMMSGMGRIFSYENTPLNPQLPDKMWADKQVYKDDRMPHLMAQNDFATNGNDGMAMLSNTRWQVGTEWRLGYHNMHGYETETHLGRFIGKNQWFMPFVGFDWRYRKLEEPRDEHNLFGQKNTKDNRNLFSLGADYILPGLITLRTEIYHNGDVRVQLMREDIALSKRLRLSMMINTDKEYMAGLHYILTKFLSVSTHYDSDMGLGFGIMANY